MAVYCNIVMFLMWLFFYLVFALIYHVLLRENLYRDILHVSNITNEISDIFRYLNLWTIYMMIYILMVACPIQNTQQDRIETIFTSIELPRLFSLEKVDSHPCSKIWVWRCKILFISLFTSLFKQITPRIFSLQSWPPHRSP